MKKISNIKEKTENCLNNKSKKNLLNEEQIVEYEELNERIIKKLNDIPKSITIGYMNENNEIIIYDEFKKEFNIRY